MDVNVRVPTTVEGAGCGSESHVPRPNCPASLIPQQYGLPPTASAHVKSRVSDPPATTCWKETPAGTATGTGVTRRVVVPSPSCPLSFAPQHQTAPPLVRPQV